MKTTVKAWTLVASVCVAFVGFLAYEYHVEAVETAFEAGRHQAWREVEEDEPHRCDFCDTSTCDFLQEDEHTGMIHHLERYIDVRELDYYECLHLGGCWPRRGNLSEFQWMIVQQRQMHFASYEPL